MKEYTPIGDVHVINYPSGKCINAKCIIGSDVDVYNFKTFSGFFFLHSIGKLDSKTKILYFIKFTF